MKYIDKLGPPNDYVQWRTTMTGVENEHYKSLQNPEKTSLLRALINEQGGLCGYTMRRIDINLSHIEHIKPEHECRKDKRGSDLDYDNMIACFPRVNMPPKDCYGAKKKLGWWQEKGMNFVSPLNVDCEKAFTFNFDGIILAANDNGPAVITINVLALDHPILTEDRRISIEQFLFGDEGNDPLPIELAWQAIQTICQPDESGLFVEFCVAIRHALIHYISEFSV